MSDQTKAGAHTDVEAQIVRLRDLGVQKIAAAGNQVSVLVADFTGNTDAADHARHVIATKVASTDAAMVKGMLRTSGRRTALGAIQDRTVEEAVVIEEPDRRRSAGRLMAKATEDVDDAISDLQAQVRASVEDLD